MPGLEAYRERLNKTEQRLRKGLDSLNRIDLEDRLCKINTIRSHIRATDKLMSRHSSGIGTTSQATIRASRGRPF